MWWLFIDPEDYGKALVVSFALIIIFVVIGYFYYRAHPEEFRECGNPSKTEEKVIQYDTVVKGDTTYIIKKSLTVNEDTLSIFKKIK